MKMENMQFAATLPESEEPLPDIESDIEKEVLSEDVSIQNADDASVEKYLKEEGLDDRFPKEKLRELVKKAQGGDKEARDELINSNSGLVFSIAKPYYNLIKEKEIISFDDLLQEGTFGLIRAIEKFDLNYDVRFSTYAYHWIRMFVQRCVENNTQTVRIPAGVLENINKYKRSHSKLGHALGQEPTSEEISEDLGIPLKDVIFIESLLERQMFSLNQEADDLDDGPSGDIGDTDSLPADELLHNTFLKEELSDYLKKNFSEKEYEVLSLKYGLDGQGEHTFKEIGERLGGVSRQRIDQIEKKIKEKLVNDPKIVELKENFDE